MSSIAFNTTDGRTNEFKYLRVPLGDYWVKLGESNSSMQFICRGLMSTFCESGTLNDSSLRNSFYAQAEAISQLQNFL